MPNPITYSATKKAKSLKKNDFYLGTNDEAKGPTSSTGFFAGITPPSGGYTIYYKRTATQMYRASNDAELILITKSISGTEYSTAAQCLDYYRSQTDKMCVNRDYENIVTDGLILNLDAGYTPSYPRTGTVWYDVSEGGNNATMYNGLTYNAGGWMDFDGTDDFCEITYNNSNMADWSTGQTISIWMYHNISSGRRNPWNQAYGGYGTWTHEQGGAMNYYYGNAGSNANPYTALGSSSTPVNTWLHMCVTRTTSTVKWYVNGTEVSSQGNTWGPLAATTSNIWIGYGYTGVYWQGRMSIIQAYNRGLSASEVLQNYNAQKGRFGL